MKLKEINLETMQTINSILYIAFVVFYSFALAIYGMGEDISRYRYFIWALTITMRIYNNYFKFYK